MPETPFIVRRLDTLLKDEGGDVFFERIKNSFMSKNPDVEHFLKNSAVHSMKLHQSSTYLVLTSDLTLSGYFTLALKVVRIDAGLLSKTESNKLQRFSLPDKLNNSFIVPAILIWEDRVTTWSGIPDKLVFRIDIYDSTEQLISSATLEGRSPVMVWGGNDPIELAEEPLKKYFANLFLYKYGKKV